MTEDYPPHSLRINRDKCIGCVICMRACPTRAIRIRSRKAVINDALCIDCGECLRVCPHQAVDAITTSYSEVKSFRYKIAIPSPVLYSQFGPEAIPADILGILTELGFDQVYDEALVCEMTNLAIEEYLDEHKAARPVISSTCPVVVRLIQRMFPSLCSLIMSLEPPREIAAKHLRDEICRERRLKADEIGIIHITPCPAKLVSINRPETLDRSYLDGAVSIYEIYNQIMMKLKKTKPAVSFHSQHRTSSIGVNWAIAGGETRGLKYYHTISVSGVYDTIRILEDVESGKLKNIEYLECLICPDGCVGGPLTVENRFIAKSNIQRLTRVLGDQRTVDPYLVKRLYRDHYFSFGRAVQPKPFPPLDDNRDRAIRKMELKEQLIKRLPGINCGVCGAPDCKTLADDIARGLAKIEDCIYVEEAGAQDGREEK